MPGSLGVSVADRCTLGPCKPALKADTEWLVVPLVATSPAD